MSEASPHPRVFVYGTLKRGERNHEPLCRNASRIEPATTRGRLYHLPFGFPGLAVDRGETRGLGTRDYLHDVRQQQSLPEAEKDTPDSLVHGELISFPDPNHLAALDALEGYVPGEKGLYERVLLPVETQSQRSLAWAYVLRRAIGAHLPDGHWTGLFSN